MAEGLRAISQCVTRAPAAPDAEVAPSSQKALSLPYTGFIGASFALHRMLSGCDCSRSFRAAESRRKVSSARAGAGKNVRCLLGRASSLGSRRHQSRRARSAHASCTSRCRRRQRGGLVRTDEPDPAQVLGNRIEALQHYLQDRDTKKNSLPRNEASSRSSRGSLAEL